MTFLPVSAWGLSLKRLENLAFRLGETSYDTVEPIFVTPLGNYPGRKGHASAAGIENVWMGCSQIASRANRDEGNLGVTHGGKAKIARSTASNVTRTLNTAY